MVDETSNISVQLYANPSEQVIHNIHTHTKYHHEEDISEVYILIYQDDIQSHEKCPRIPFTLSMIVVGIHITIVVHVKSQILCTLICVYTLRGWSTSM